MSQTTALEYVMHSLRTAITLLALCLIHFNGRASLAQDAVPLTFLHDGTALAGVAQRARASDSRIAPAIEQLRRDAQEAMSRGPFSVVNKPFLAPSGDPHDFYCHGIYLWPNPDRPDGLPWQYHDGKANPDARRYDKGWIEQMADASLTLALAGYLLDDPRCSQRAALLIRTWFINPDTRQNPHFAYADETPGKPDSGGQLITMSLTLPHVIEAAQLLRACGAWPAADDEALQDWFDQYLTWADATPYNAHNRPKNHNHITHYDILAITICRYLGRDDEARLRASAVAGHQIAGQIAPSGEMPQETRRTKSMDYTIMNLRGLMELAELARPLGVDLWHAQTDDGRSIQRALDYLVSHLDGSTPWPHQQVARSNPTKLIPVLHLAARVWPANGYRETLTKLVDADDVLADRVNLLFPVSGSQ